MNEKWCSHIVGSRDGGTWYFVDGYGTGFADDAWNLCPVCGVKRPEKKEPRMVAPALIKNSSGRWVLTKALYDSQEDAGHELMGTDTPPLAVVWPAIPDQDGYIRIPVDE